MIIGIMLLLGLIALSCYLALWWHEETLLTKPWVPDPDAVLFSKRPLPRLDTSFPSPALVFAPLRTQGRHILDARNQKFKLASVNWYGASDELFIPGGLDIQHRSDIAKTIRRLGFNSVRLPYADEMVVSNPPILPHLLAANADLVGLRALEIFEAVVNALTDAGLAVIINDHITHATWCCGADPCDALWHNEHLGPICRVRQTEDQWIENWETIMRPHINNSLVIGADLRNEVRSLWGTLSWETWAIAAERAGNRLLEMNPNWLMVVGGTGSGNFLSGARRRPVVLSIPNRVVYSAHVYSWSGWGSAEGRYSKRPYPSFARAMRDNWGYLLDEDIAPVWVGEFGAPHFPSNGDAHYWTNLMRYIAVTDAGFGYWALNPRKPKLNEKESYSLVEDDWETPVLDYRMRDMRRLML
jgi:aryl-phospho-beta-D-glucosidase BglC (GH1 family)